MGLILLFTGAGLLVCLGILLSILVLRVRQARQASKQSCCYYCGGKTLHLSAPGGLTDLLLTNWNCLPYRCEICFRRHYRLRRAPE
jgi:hypothetical protein